MKSLIGLAFICSLLYSPIVNACTPCQALSNITQTIVGSNLELTFTSNTGWDCCYTVNIEIVCQNATFTGVANYFSPQICHINGNNMNQPYGLTVIDISNFCPGQYKWRALETSCNVLTQEFFFTIPGPGLVLTASSVEDSICLGDNTQLNALGVGGCNAGVINYQWAPAAGLSNPAIANPIATPAATTIYTITAQESNSCGAPQTQDVTIFVHPPAQVSASMLPDTCTSGSGTVIATPVQGVPPYTFLWPTLGNANTSVVTGVLTGNHTVEMTDSNGCIATATVFVGDSPALYQGTTTPVSCAGGNDGTAFAEIVPLFGNVDYLWDDPAGQITQTAIGLTAGAYTCFISTDMGCSGSVILVVIEPLPLVGNVINQTDVTCNSGNDGILEVTVNQGTPPYTYAWNNSASTLNIADDLSAGNHTCTVTDFNGCILLINGVLGEPSPLDITFLTPNTVICPEDDIELTVVGAGGSSPYTFSWSENGVDIGAGTSIIVNPVTTNTEYCVILSELCGSPTDQECTIIDFFPPIVPASSPLQMCNPSTFELLNLSSNSVDIANTYWEFGDYDTHTALTLGDNPVSHYYEGAGVYNVTMVVTSIHGCVYADTLFGLVEVLADPVADFDFSVNPTNIFETTIFAQDHSSPNVINWYWDSPFSNPPTSTETNPYFTFPIGEPGNYPVTLIVETDLGCLDTITLFFEVIEQAFYAPNAFTPDDDEFNQVWKPEVIGFDLFDFDLFVFNRWGELIWESHDVSVGWDGTYNGKIVESGVYVWKAVTKDPHKDERKVYRGTINLLK